MTNDETTLTNALLLVKERFIEQENIIKQSIKIEEVRNSIKEICAKCKDYESLLKEIKNLAQKN